MRSKFAKGMVVMMVAVLATVLTAGAVFASDSGVRPFATQKVRPMSDSGVRPF